MHSLKGISKIESPTMKSTAAQRPIPSLDEVNDTLATLPPWPSIWFARSWTFDSSTSGALSEDRKEAIERKCKFRLAQLFCTKNPF